MGTVLQDRPLDPLSAFAALAPAFPDVEIVAGAVLLRPYTEADTESHRALFDHHEARRWSSAPQPYPVASAVQWCTSTARSIRSSGDGICWAVEELATGHLIGMTGLHRTDWRTLTTEVSANGVASALGRGHATRILRVICHWVLADQGFASLRITTPVGHRAPALLARTCGFRPDAAAIPSTVAYHLKPADLRERPLPDYTVRPVVSRRSPTADTQPEPEAVP